MVGGGGLVQLPALLIGFPGATPVQILATNKLARYRHDHEFDHVSTASEAGPSHCPTAGGVCAFAGSICGALIASQIPKAAFNPIILVVLVAVVPTRCPKPSVGSISALRFSGRMHLAVAGVIGFVIGAYDGALGPGTGSFLVFALVGLLGYGFLQASAKAKIANFATNLAALIVFIPQGAVMWQIGLLMGVCNVAGGYIGARTAVAKGSGFVRVVFVIVVSAFIVKIGYDTFVQFT